MYHYHAPLDPECPEVNAFYESLDDPIMRESGCTGEFIGDFENRHRLECERCKEYGLANLEVV